jgi:hypothetical protein
MKLGVLSIAIAIVLGLPAAAVADDAAAAALLAKHYAYVGWQYGDGRVPTMKISEHTSRLSKSGELTERFKSIELVRGLVYRDTVVSGSTSDGGDTGFTGHIFWSSNENGFTVPERGDGVKNRIARQVVFYEATTTLPATVRKEDTIDGVPVTVIRETIPHAYPVDLYVDPATGAYKRVVFDPDGSAYALDIASYIDFGDKKRAIGQWHYRGSANRHVVDSIESGVEITPEELHPPASTAQWTFGDGSAIPIEVRTPDFREGSASPDVQRIYVRAKVNGIDGRFILDTGSSGIAFTDSFRRRIHAQEITRSKARGIAGDISTIVQRVDTIAFSDGSVLKNVIVDSGIAEDNEIVDGLMGFDFLGGAIVDVNLDKQTIHLSDPATTTPPEAGGFIFFPDLSGLTPVVPVVLGGTAHSNVLLDSGNPSFALVASNYLSRVRVLIDNGNLGSAEAIGGVSGGYEIDRCAKLSNIAMGPISYDGVPVCFSPSVSDREGIVGFDFIKHFNITFDYPDGKMIFFPRK